MAKIAAGIFKQTAKANIATGSRSAGRGANQQQEIERLAYQFFVERGYEHGHDQEDWTRAERIIKSRLS